MCEDVSTSGLNSKNVNVSDFQVGQFMPETNAGTDAGVSWGWWGDVGVVVGGKF